MPRYQEKKMNKKFLSLLIIAILLSTFVSMSALVYAQLRWRSVRANAQKNRVIIDTDPGIDDAIALMMALRSDSLQIEAITIAPGNVESELGSQNALKILEHMGRKDIHVAVGATHPLNKPLVTDPYFHGTNGLGMVSLPTPHISVIETNAVDLIISEIMESPGEITLVTLGPLTNLAMAIEKEPAIIENVRAVISMAGAIYVPGFLNNDNAEFNVFTDPEAAKIVFTSGIPIRMAGLEVCYKVKFTKELLNGLAGIDTHMAKLIVQMANYEVWKQLIESGQMIMADPTAMSALLQPDIFESETIAVDAIVSGELEGKTIEDTASPNKNVEILLKVDIEEVYGLLLDLARIADDVSPPTITDIVYSPQSPTPDDPVVVSAKVTDAYSRVDVVNLLYSTSVGGSWSSLVMSHGNMTYTAMIPRQADGKTIQFKISAEDNAGNTAESSITSYIVHAPPSGIPGYPLEAVYLSIVMVVAALTLLKKKQSRQCQRHRTQPRAPHRGG
jgi:ribosylpyrimidine nucleosidase